MNRNHHNTKPICRAACALALSSLFGPTPGLCAPAHWVKMPLLSPESKKAGVFPGGEGAQWPRGPVAVSAADPDFLLLPIDVGGLYRSLDGGKTWGVTMVGWDARGANGFAIDPRNASHVLGMGGNSMMWDPNWGPSPHGVYRSDDKAASWKHVLASNAAFFGVVAFDPTSYDAAKHLCTRAYYLQNSKALYRSEDGGTTWTPAAKLVLGAPGRDWTAGGGLPDMFHVTREGTLYAAGWQGLYRSEDHGAAFTPLRKDPIYGMSVTPDGTIFVSGDFGVQRSTDGGKTFTDLACKGLVRQDGGPVNEIVVSPADPKKMLCWTTTAFKKGDYNFVWPRYVSQDGGETWQPVTLDHTNESIVYTGRQGYAAWSPTDPNVAYNLGGDWVTKSVDGGKTFRWSNNGYNGVMTGGLFNFNPKDPKTVYIGFQDYNGAITRDGGQTWTVRNISGLTWGGQQYGGYALNAKVMWSGDANDSWTGPRRLRITRDGGEHWGFVNGPDGKPLIWHGPDVSSGDPRDPKTGFASNYRTTDGGTTWAAMDGCDGVYTAGPKTGALYGKKANAVVRSTDHGVTWKTLVDVPGGFMDLAVDEVRDRVYTASEDHLKVWDGKTLTILETPHDQFDNQRVWTVATDPGDPRVVYVGGPRNTYANQATVCRSADGGQTWENLTVTTPLGAKGEGGPHEVSAIRVHPKTHEAWVAGQCYGLWRIAAPGKDWRGLPAAAASAPKAATPPVAP